MDDHLFAVENAKAIEAGGGAAVSMHARTKAQALYRKCSRKLALAQKIDRKCQYSGHRKWRCQDS